MRIAFNAGILSDPILRGWNFSWAQTAKDTLAIYENLCAGPAKVYADTQPVS